MHPSCFSGQDPLPWLLYANKSKEYISSKYLFGVDYEETEDSKTFIQSLQLPRNEIWNLVYPESEDECASRVQD